MKAIWKYPLKTTDFQEVEMPLGSKILTVQTQEGIPCLWALVTQTEKMKEKHSICILGTGHPADAVSANKYIGTYQLRGGALVFHVFEV